MPQVIASQPHPEENEESEMNFKYTTEGREYQLQPFPPLTRNYHVWLLSQA